MSVWAVLAFGIPIIIGAIIAVVIFVEQENRNKKYRACMEENFRALNEKLDVHLYQDGIPFLKEKDKQAIYDRALATMKAAKYNTTITILSDFLKRYLIPDSEKCAALDLIGISFRKLGKYNESISSYTEISLIADRIGDIIIHSLAWSNKSFALNMLGRHEEALQACEKAISLKPDFPEAWSNKSFALNMLGRHEEAFQACEKAILLKPDFPEAWNNKGYALNMLGRHEEALQVIDRAIELKPNNPVAWSNKGFALNMLGQPEEALQACEKAILLKPDFPEAWNNKGFALNMLGRYEDALQACEGAIGLKPDDPKAWYNSACSFSLQKNNAEALKRLSKAIELDANYKAMAKNDTDFEWLWDDPDFKKLVE